MEPSSEPGRRHELPRVDFPEAGRSEDLAEARRLSTIHNYRDTAQRLRAESERHLRGARPDRSRAEQCARQALVNYAKCLDWAEDTGMEAEAHWLMDRAGRWTLQVFGCEVTWDGSNYQRDCPVDLAHNRVGLSVGGVAKRKCSLCGGDASECPHRPDMAYEVPGGPSDLGWCRICLRSDCGHSADDVERVAMVSIVHKIDLEEVSLVGKPAQPEARLTSISLPIAEIEQAVGKDVLPGTTVRCRRCAATCTGLTKHDSLST